MSNQIGWSHPIDNADQWDGFNESGMQHFAGNPIRHLAREVIQNALDAHVTDSGCVVVKIKLRDIPVSEIPNLDELKTNIEACNRASKAEGRKAEIFFNQALKELDKRTIQVLEISDFNTTGMDGPSENGTPFYAFMKARGQSKKTSDTATGSYGIGKFAPYTVSKIRTIFLSTVYVDNANQHIQLTQGKSILMSHDDGDVRKQGTGFWGVKEKCQPLKGIDNSVSELLTRASTIEDLSKSRGSKLSVLCFDAQKNWQEILVVSIVENYFAAIWDGNLRVEVDDKYVLEKNTISQIYNDKNSKNIELLIKDQKNEPEQFMYSRNYLTAYQKGVEVFVEESQTNSLGLCELRIWVSENLPKKVCALRNGMFITDNLTGLRQFSDFKEFVAVFTCHDKKGNELLRSMEPPRHDDFEVDLLPTKEEQIKGKKALREIAVWVRECLKRHAKDPVSDVTEIDELKDFFGEEGDSDTGKGTQEINPYGAIIIRGKPIKTKLKSSKDPDDIDLDGEGHGEGTSDGGGGLDGAGGGDGLGGSGSGSGGSSGGGERVNVEISNIRAPVIGRKERKVSFTPMKTGKINIQVKEAGADVDYDVGISKSSLGSINKAGGLILDVVSGNRITLDIELSQEFSGALKVVAYEV
jgi:uncharacterized membrane protein YgcG